MRLDGIHHITAITADAPRAVDFYGRLLGLRLVKTTVNYDDPGMYHLYFGDEDGRPGGILTFFEIPGAAPGRPGDGQFHTITWRVAGADALAFWADRLGGDGVRVTHHDGQVAFADPEGMALRIAAAPGGDPAAAARAEGVPPEHALRGFLGVGAASRAPGRTRQVLIGGLGLGERDGALTVDGPSRSGRIDLGPQPMGRGVPGAGTIHHVALASRDADHEGWLRRLTEAGAHATPIVDRTYFRSIYFREPGGLLVEVATEGPGFAVDEPADRLGTTIALPAWLEPHRPAIEGHLTPLRNPRAAVAA
ncbi:MAG: VOC family protein [Thermoleophilia bacterium]|jgi:glyoxalase family protein|nr:VOC family protein [Thermoleophilia bacterium]